MLLFANNADTTLKTLALATDVTLYLADGTGARFPNPGVGDSFFLTLIDGLGNVEIVECTARVVDVITVVRARDGTTAKGFPSGSVVDHRITAEVLRRLSPDALRGADGGLAPLDVDGRLPLIHLPTTLLTQSLADARYAQIGTANVAGGYPLLDAGGKVTLAQLPAELVTVTEADAAYVPLTSKGAALGVATLDAAGKVPVAQIDYSAVDLSPYAPKIDPTFPNGLTAGGTATLTAVVVAGPTQAAAVTASTVDTSGNVTIKGGAPRGKLTLSTSVPSGVPANGDEWVQHEA